MSDQKARPAKTWFASGSVAVSAAKPIYPIGRHDEDKANLSNDKRKENAARSTQFLAAYRSGRDLSAAEVGEQFALRPGRNKPQTPQPFMKMFGRYVVTAETRALLEKLDPGPLRFFPVEVLNAARTAPLGAGSGAVRFAGTDLPPRRGGRGVLRDQR
ncbi:hypothetical protein [Jannaschia ovalis]|uniref:Uncharacterized protein n=1 Tax=Jannaschia ovalis TaxID=3038773 RepID=A0ABY8LFI6_9RHOB|nr:hypothetical protein [Jannaschia sp. GRR-S6-38]WGH80031.1 hypothetical protein P8627_07155 [Jannaschia sp. GRR-S6-38]